MCDVVQYTAGLVRCVESRYGPSDRRTYLSLVAYGVGAYWSGGSVRCVGCGDDTSMLNVGEPRLHGGEVRDAFSAVDSVDIGAAVHASCCRGTAERGSGDVGLVNKLVEGVDRVVNDAEVKKVDEDDIEVVGSEKIVGKHHKRNVRKRELKREKQDRSRMLCSGIDGKESDGVSEKGFVRGSVSGADGGDVVNCQIDGGSESKVRTDSGDFVSMKFSGGYFSECSQEVRKKLKESRAAMLVAQNELRAAQAAEKLRVMQLEKSTRLVESRFELNRVTVEDKLAKITESRLGMPGSAETVVSSAIPSLSSGSVSPNSSISVAEEMKLRRQLGSCLEKIAKLEESIKVKERMDGLGHDWGDSESAESIYGDDVITGMFVDR